MNDQVGDSNRKVGGKRTRGTTRRNLPDTPLVSVVTVVKNGAPQDVIEQTIASIYGEPTP